jgi:DNA-binding SARP family transcriptional activator
MRGRAARLLLDRGDPLRAGTIALAADDAGLLDRAATALVAGTLATFPLDTGQRWLAAAPAEDRQRPGLLLLAAATRHAGRAGDTEVDDLLDTAAALAREHDDPGAETAALSLATIAAHARGDENRLAELFQRVIELPGAEAEATLRLLVGGVRGAMFELFGSLGDALAAVEALAPEDVRDQPGLIVARFHVYLLLLAGRADEAAEVADRCLAEAPYAHVRLMPILAHWLAGRPAHLLREWRRPDPLHVPEVDANDRYRFNFLAFAAVVAASVGDRAALHQVSAQLDAGGLGDDTRDAAMLAVAAAAGAVLDGDESAARNGIEAFVADHPLDDPVASVHLRRFLAYGYVLSPQCRRRWDTESLGPAHQRVRDTARLLVAARAGRLGGGALPPPETVVTAFPLPWAVELAVHAEAAGLPDGRRLMRWLADHLGPIAHEMLPAGAVAGRLAAAVPATPPGRTRIEVLGPLRILHDGVVVDPPEMRRRRVRELLELLVLHGDLYRDRAGELLWPDLDPAAAGRNLRVTLAYLRRALEPHGSHLRADRDRIRLAPTASLEIDLYELRGHLDEARRAAARGDPAAAGPELAAAVELWRGEPCTELLDGAVRTSILAELTAAALALGERRLTEGDPAAARDLAQRVLGAEPYAERALRLLLAAATQHRDPAGLAEAIDRVRDTLAGLGVTGEPATVVVLRQAHLAAGGVRLSAPRPVRPAR